MDGWIDVVRLSIESLASIGTRHVWIVCVEDNASVNQKWRQPQGSRFQKSSAQKHKYVGNCNFCVCMCVCSASIGVNEGPKDRIIRSIRWHVCMYVRGMVSSVIQAARCIGSSW